jgi:ribosomal protein S18 acetylase RimI-like enzyme
MWVTPLDPSRFDEAVEVLCDAFADYPVMRFVIGEAGAAYPSHLRALVAFFTTARFLNGDLVLGVATVDGALAAVANITPPGARLPSPQLSERREQLWRELGDAARARYETLGAIWRTFTVERPHYHLNMIGVRRSHQGKGAARALLDALHARSAAHADSCGVSLTTEAHTNVAVYRHFGYEVIGRAHVSGALETWGMFRPDRQQA